MDYFFDNFVSIVTGVNFMKKHATLAPVETWLSVSSEAFAFVAYDNFYDVVKAETSCTTTNKKKKTKKSNTAVDKASKETKYTISKKQVKRNQGWSLDGITAFNEIVQEIQEQWVKNKDIYEAYYERKKKEGYGINDARTRKKLATIQEREEGWIGAYEDEIELQLNENKTNDNPHNSTQPASIQNSKLSNSSNVW